jgi:hypothetical protein
MMIQTRCQLLRRQARAAICAFTIALVMAGCVSAPQQIPTRAPGEILFEHENPTFSLRFPESWTFKDPGEREYVHVAAAKGAPNIIVAPADLLEDPDADRIAQQDFQSLKASQSFRVGEIAYAREVALSDGTPAYETLIRWRHPLYRVKLATLYLQVLKDDTALKLIATDLGDDLSEQHRHWCYSLHVQ